ncbi:MAG: hypothetical protein HYU75_21300 [Betaproteobacteria bacterium]|nr:hypothetical protein [Betaproteobacteria bacterium]
MPVTIIDTGKIPGTKSQGQGEVSEVLNRALCGTHNVRAMLRWLEPGESYQAGAQQNFQLVYLMEGNGTICLEDNDYAVAKGAGVFLGPAESATIRCAGGASLKLFHIVVPQIAK